MTIIKRKSHRIITGLTRNLLVMRGMLKQVQHNVSVLAVSVLIFAAIICFTACGDWLDVVPEGSPTLDMAFNSRIQSLKFLATCYSYMPKNGHIEVDPAILGCDETVSCHSNLSMFSYLNYGYDFAHGMQNASTPLFYDWSNLYQGLRDCNIFLENAGLVPDLPSWECDQWMAEVKVLKAYYHFCLVQRYGPVPLVRENIPVSADVTAVKVERAPVDECFQYIVELLNEATDGDLLPIKVLDEVKELGRITKPIALAIKAKVLVTAASPLYNGNEQLATLRNRDGTQLFNTTPDPTKWQKAVVACKEAIDACHKANIELYRFPNAGLNKLTDTIAVQMSLRNAFNLRWNSDLIWANTQSLCTDMQWYATPKLNGSLTTYMNERFLSVPLKIVSMFYTDKGVPLEEDRTRDVSVLYNLRTAMPVEKLYLKTGDHNIDLNFDREPRFYAWVGFDGGIWYGQGRNDDKGELWVLAARNGSVDNLAPYGTEATGYIPKKHIPYTNVASTSGISTLSYPWPIMRLSDLYLLYAEAINEAEGTNGAGSAELFKYIDLIRDRAGLKGVKYSWDTYTNNKKYNTKEGMRDIIRQERMIELYFEGHRFWDIRRWKTAPELYRTHIEGFSPEWADDVGYYTVRLINNQKFGIRDYFWPIKNSDIINNRNLVQNIGW